MGLPKLFKDHFIPWQNPKQVKDDSYSSYALGISGLTLMTTAAIGYSFFNARLQTAAMLGAAGAGFFASYLTEKDGYAYLVALIAAAGLTYATLDAAASGRLWVTVHFDIGDIIRALRETKPTTTT